MRVLWYLYFAFAVTTEMQRSKSKTIRIKCRILKKTSLRRTRATISTIQIYSSISLEIVIYLQLFISVALEAATVGLLTLVKIHEPLSYFKVSDIGLNTRSIHMVCNVHRCAFYNLILKFDKSHLNSLFHIEVSGWLVGTLGCRWYMLFSRNSHNPTLSYSLSFSPHSLPLFHFRLAIHGWYLALAIHRWYLVIQY